MYSEYQRACYPSRNRKLPDNLSAEKFELAAFPRCFENISQKFKSKYKKEFIDWVKRFYSPHPCITRIKVEDWSIENRPQKEYTRHLISEILGEGDNPAKKNILLFPSDSGRDVTLFHKHNIFNKHTKFTFVDNDPENVDAFVENMICSNVFTENDFNRRISLHNDYLNKLNTDNQPYDLAWFDFCGLLRTENVTWIKENFKKSKNADIFLTTTLACRERRPLNPCSNIKAFFESAKNFNKEKQLIPPSLAEYYENDRRSFEGISSENVPSLPRAAATHLQILKYIFKDETFNFDVYYYKDKRNMVLFHLYNFNKRPKNHPFPLEAPMNLTFNLLNNLGEDVGEISKRLNISEDYIEKWLRITGLDSLWESTSIFSYLFRLISYRRIKYLMPFSDFETMMVELFKIKSVRDIKKYKEEYKKIASENKIDISSQWTEYNIAEFMSYFPELRESLINIIWKNRYSCYPKGAQNLREDQIIRAVQSGFAEIHCGEAIPLDFKINKDVKDFLGNFFFYINEDLYHKITDEVADCAEQFDYALAAETIPGKRTYTLNYTGKDLRVFREKYGLHQSQLANLLGTSQGHLSLMEVKNKKLMKFKDRFIELLNQYEYETQGQYEYETQGQSNEEILSGKDLRKFREQYNLSQSALAKLLGTSQTHLSRMEINNQKLLKHRDRFIELINLYKNRRASRSPVQTQGKSREYSGNDLRLFREKYNLTQADLAKSLGTSQTLLSRMERNNTKLRKYKNRFIELLDLNEYQQPRPQDFCLLYMYTDLPISYIGRLFSLHLSTIRKSCLQFNRPVKDLRKKIALEVWDANPLGLGRETVRKKAAQISIMLNDRALDVIRDSSMIDPYTLGILETYNVKIFNKSISGETIINWAKEAAETKEDKKVEEFHEDFDLDFKDKQKVRAEEIGDLPHIRRRREIKGMKDVVELIIQWHKEGHKSKAISKQLIDYGIELTDYQVRGIVATAKRQGSY